jgi:hypothetical protein
MRDSPIRKFVERSVQKMKECDSSSALPGERDARVLENLSFNSNNAFRPLSSYDGSDDRDNQKYIKIRIDI